MASSKTDSDLVRRYCDQAEEAAFAEIVDRYIGLVLSVALRRSGNRSFAEDVAQDVFRALARKAASFREPINLAAWLQRSANLETSFRLRTEHNRRRKMEAYQDHLDRSESGEDLVPDEVWKGALPHLDGAIAALPASDREVVLQRFFHGLSFREIGRRIHKTEGATQRQSSRAVRKLERYLRRKKVILPAAGIATVLGGLAAPPSSAALVANITTNALAGTTTTAAASAAVGQAGLLAMTSTKTAALVGAAALLIAVPVAIHSLNPDPGSAADESPTGESAAVGIPSSSPAAPAAPAPAPAAETAHAGAVSATISPESGRRLVNELENLLREGDPLGTSKVALRLNKISADEALDAYKFMESLSPHQRGNHVMWQAFWMRWGEVDPEAAIARLEAGVPPHGESDRDLKHIFKGFAQADPLAAAQYVRDNPRMPDRHRAIEGLAVSWAEKDAERTTAWVLAELDGQDLEYALRAIPWSINTINGHQDALAWWKTIETSPASEAAYGSLCEIFLGHVNTEFEERVELAEAGIIRGIRHSPLLIPVAKELGRSDPRRGIDLLTSTPPAAGVSFYAGLDNLVATWADHEPVEAGTWLRGQMGKAWADTAILGYAVSIHSKDPDAAAEWIGRIENEQIRRRREFLR